MTAPEFRQPLTPTMAVTGVVLCFGLAAMVAWFTFLRGQGLRTELEAQILGCRPLSLTGEDDGAWLIRIDQLPYEVRLERSDDADAALQGVCVRGTRVRLVTRERDDSLEGSIAWVQELEELEQGRVVVSEEDALTHTRRNRIAGMGVFALFTGLGVVGAVFGVRDFRERAQRRKTHRAPPPLRSRAPMPAPRSAALPRTGVPASLPAVSSHSAPAPRPGASLTPSPGVARTRPEPARRKGPGPLLFRRFSALDNPIVGVLFGLGMLVGAWALARPPGPNWIGAVGLGLFGVATLFATWRLRPSILHVHAHAVTLRQWLTAPVTLLDDEVVGLAIGTTEFRSYGILAGTSTDLTLLSSNGQHLTFKSERWRQDKDLLAVYERLLPQVTERLLAKLQAGQEIPWGDTFLSQQGLRVGEGAAAEYFSFAELRFELSESMMQVAGLNGMVIASIPARALNFLPGVEILESLLHMNPRSALH